MSHRAYQPGSAFTVGATDRLTFIRKTYLHLAGAIGLFVALSALLYSAGVGAAVVGFLGESRYGWLLILGGFMMAGYLGQSLARSSRSLGAQYLGLGIYAAAEALIFTPLIYIAAQFAPGVLPEATILTLFVFTGLTAYAFLSKTDFSFLRAGLVVGGFLVMALILISVIFGLTLGVWFSAAMVLFASAAVLYSTSNVIRNYGTDQYVAAALDLFAAIALLFWYVLQFLLASQRR